MESAIKFLMWTSKRTTHIQNNVKKYKGQFYFIDGENHKGRNDLKELYNEFIKDVTGQ